MQISLRLMVFLGLFVSWNIHLETGICKAFAMLWFNPRSQLSITQALTPHSGMGERIRRLKEKTWVEIKMI